MTSSDKAMRLSLMSVTLNLSLALVKGVAGVMGHSQALIADAVESALDVFSGLAVLYGLRIALRPADDNHPYGHGKAEPLAGAVVALSLLVGAAGIAFTSAHEILVPHEPPAAYTLVVLAVVVFLKEGVFRVISHGGSELGSTALLGDAWHHRSDALTSAAAFVGISVALLGGPGYEAADDWAALLACGIIGWNGWRLLQPALAELMDEVPNTSTEAAVREAASSVPGVLGIETCLVRKTGLAYLVDLHVEVDGDLTVREGHRIAHESKDAVMAAVPQVLDVLVHVEPVPHPKDMPRD
jgi:cation diffusion facilitator family transporter